MGWIINVKQDLKPNNIAINSECHLKIIDFGLSRQVLDKELCEKNVWMLLTPYVMVRNYRAPEIFFRLDYNENGCFVKKFSSKIQIFSWRLVHWVHFCRTFPRSNAFPRQQRSGCDQGNSEQSRTSRQFSCSTNCDRETRNHWAIFKKVEGMDKDFAKIHISCWRERRFEFGWAKKRSALVCIRSIRRKNRFTELETLISRNGFTDSTPSGSGRVISI